MTWLRIGFVVVALALVTLVLLPFQLAALALDLKVRRQIPRVWHRFVCRLLGIRIHVHGQLDTRRPVMLAANHASWKDILVLGAIAEVTFIAKSEVAAWPVF
ncbi:MAG: lysophospholipid acyltransferase family protein, partial [Pseudorhizobium sp.]